MKPAVVTALLVLAALALLWLTRDRYELSTWLEDDDGIQPLDCRTGEMVTVLRRGGQGESWRVRREWLA